MTHIDKEYYNQLPQNEVPINRAKCHEENIGRRYVKYTLYPNGTVEIAVKSSDTPFKIEIDEDVSIIFFFLGQVKDRLLYLVRDPKERHVPPVMEWILKQCALNKDVEMTEKAQVTLPDIQLKTVDGVFRLYIKSLTNKAVCRAEESLKVGSLLPEALDSIRCLYKSIESKLSKILDILQRNENTIDDSSLAANAPGNDVVGGR
jgi:hypothetical protein